MILPDVNLINRAIEYEAFHDLIERGELAHDRLCDAVVSFLIPKTEHTIRIEQMPEQGRSGER